LPDESDGNLDKKRDFINIRFPIEKIAKNKKLKKEIYELAEKLKKTDMKISQNQTENFCPIGSL